MIIGKDQNFITMMMVGMIVPTVKAMLVKVSGGVLLFPC